MSTTTNKSTTKKDKKSEGFTAEEKAAMKARAKELKAAAEGEEAVLSALAAMSPDDRALGKRIHAIVKETAPDLTPKTWYGMPAYANKDGKVVLYFRNAEKFKERYAMLGFNDTRQPRRRVDVAGRLRVDQADQGRRGQDREAPQAGGELKMNETTVTTPNELEIRVERVFDAPPAHVFSVWTDPQLIPEWWGDGTVVEEMDVRPGGRYRFRTPMGVVEGEFREVDAPERLVQTFQNHLQTLEFEDLGEQTKLTQTMRFATSEERDTTMQYGVEEGAKGGFARIDALLQRLPLDA